MLVIPIIIAATAASCNTKDKLFIDETIKFPDLRYYNPVSDLFEECTDTSEYDYT